MKNHAKGFLDLVSDALIEVPEVDVFEVKSKIENGQDIYLIDVREDHEWIESKIPTSIHIGKGVIERDIESIVPQKEKEIILYCQGGYRSALAAESLKKMGYSNVYSMQGGFGYWVSNNFETL